MKTLSFAFLFAAALMPTPALGQTVARTPVITNGSPYGPGVPVVNAPVWGAYGPTTQGVPVYWWLDPGFVWNPYNLYGFQPYAVPPIVAGPGLFGPPALYGPPYSLPPQMNGGMGMPDQAQPRPQPPAGAKAKKEEKPKPERPRDNLDQQAAMHRELRAGNQSLASGQNTAALRHYELAAQAQPLDALPLFHQAQAQIALGQYGKAATAALRGLKWQPDWPAADFNPRALYGERGSGFDQHLAALAQAIERNPNDDSLLFLMGYELWFDGKKDQAKTIFKRAASLTADRTAVDRFLR